ncbi:MAG: aromatic ring-hydroxylating dioxygenase subunit alpha [Kiloniellales bacterium]|nr:aromatic ring-hydroxylating dioxygenase subunit alpha [Kiloniellales bacterium]
MPTAAPETLPAIWYHDPDRFQEEKETIFKRHWWMIGPEALLWRPGDYVSGEIAGLPVFVIRSRDGALVGFHNVCRHRAGPLVREPCGHIDRLRCTYHGWLYDFEGRLKKAPGLALGEDIDSEQFSLFKVRAQSWNGMVFVTLSEDTPDLFDWLGDIPKTAKKFPAASSLSYQGEAEKEGRCNWKTYGDNSCEGYHVPLVHQSLKTALGKESVSIHCVERGQYIGFDVTYNSSASDPTRSGKGYWIYKFPGLLLHFAATSFNAESVIPVSPGSIVLKRFFWADESSTACGRSRSKAIMDSASQVMAEDLAICEAVQRNLEGGIYEKGRLSPSEEPGTIYFQKLVRLALELD